MNCARCLRAMVIIGTDKNIPVYYCKGCDHTEGRSPIKETYRKDGKIYERCFVVTYGYKEGNPLKSDAGWFRRTTIIYEREIDSFPELRRA
jgi:hypothetical protein